jgi:hypothetical protein
MLEENYKAIGGGGGKAGTLKHIRKMFFYKDESTGFFEIQ